MQKRLTGLFLFSILASAASFQSAQNANANDQDVCRGVFRITHTYNNGNSIGALLSIDQELNDLVVTDWSGIRDKNQTIRNEPGVAFCTPMDGLWARVKFQRIDNDNDTWHYDLNLKVSANGNKSISGTMTRTQGNYSQWAVNGREVFDERFPNDRTPNPRPEPRPSDTIAYGCISDFSVISQFVSPVNDGTMVSPLKTGFSRGQYYATLNGNTVQDVSCNGKQISFIVENRGNNGEQVVQDWVGNIEISRVPRNPVPVAVIRGTFIQRNDANQIPQIWTAQGNLPRTR